MVAISMYRGNLHKLSDVPRRWLIPEHKLSFKDFKSLLHRRKRALVLLFPESNHKPDSVSEQEAEKPSCDDPSSSFVLKPVEVKTDETVVNPVQEDDDKRGGVGDDATGVSDGRYFSWKETEVKVKKEDDLVVREDGISSVLEKPNDAPNEKVEVKAAADIPGETEQRKKEIEQKLQVLSKKKHNLVQVLKQILDVEEELKRRNNIQQGITLSRPSIPLQVDVSNDSGANNGHMEGGENEDSMNRNVQSRSMFRLRSASPSSESPLRRALAAFTQHNMVPHPSRASPGHQARPGNSIPAVSDTNYIASSPSAGLDGTSVSMDPRLQSPCN